MMVSSPHANLWWENLGDLNEEDSYIGVMRKAFGSLREPQTSLPRKSGTRCVYVYTQSSFTLQSSNCVEVARSMNEDSESNGSGGGSWELYTHANLKSGFNSVSKTLQLSAEVVAPPTNKRHEGMNMLHIFQMVPWEVDVRWHTLQLSINDENVYLIDNDIILRSDRKTVIGWCCLHPAVESVSGSTIEFLIKLPNTTKLSSLVARESHKVSLSVQITKKLLSIFDQSPDASRGIDVPAALVTLAHNASVSASALGTAIASRRTVPLLINLPIADASMPFNVVSFTCTLVALSFSSTVGVLLNPNKDKDGKKMPIKPKLRRAFLVFIVIVTLALYMDPELQRKVDGWTEKVLGLQVFSTVDS